MHGSEDPQSPAVCATAKENAIRPDSEMDRHAQTKVSNDEATCVISPALSEDLPRSLQENAESLECLPKAQHYVAKTAPLSSTITECIGRVVSHGEACAF